MKLDSYVSGYMDKAREVLEKESKVTLNDSQ